MGGNIYMRRSRPRRLQYRAFNSLNCENGLRMRCVLEPVQKNSIFVAIFSAQHVYGFVVTMRPNTEMTVPRRRSRVVITIHMLREIMSMEVLKRRVTKRRQDG